MRRSSVKQYDVSPYQVPLACGSDLLRGDLPKGFLGRPFLSVSSLCHALLNSQELELSPFASPAAESTKASSSAAEVSPLSREDEVPSSEGPQPRIISFGLSHNEGSDSDDEGR